MAQLIIDNYSSSRNVFTLGYRLLAQELKQLNRWKLFLRYQISVCKQEIKRCRHNFLDKDKKADVIPRFHEDYELQTKTFLMTNKLMTFSRNFLPKNYQKQELI